MEAKKLSLIEQMKQAAAAKYNVVTVETVETPLQIVKDVTRKVIASVTLSQAVTIVNSQTLPEGTDIDKTAAKLVQAAKRAITELSKGLQETAAAGKDVDVAILENFSMTTVKVEPVTVELPPLYKGAIVAVDFANITDEAKEKLHAVGVVVKEPYAILTSILFDKSANSIFVKVGGVDLTKGTVRLSAKFVNIVEEVNEENVVENYRGKIVELESNIVPATLKLSVKQFRYVSEKLAALKNDTDVLALFGEGYNAEIVQHIANVIGVIASPEVKK